MSRRAKKGGEIGANGEFYKGGQFINTIAENSKGQAKKRGRSTGKVQVEPFVWVQCLEGKFPILKIVGSYAKWSDDGKSIELFQPYLKHVGIDGSYKFRGQSLDSLVEKWNDGERWADDIEE